MSNQLATWGSATRITTAQKLSRMTLTIAATLPFVVAGAALILNRDGALYWTAGGVIVSIVAGVWNAWVLMVEILR